MKIVVAMDSFKGSLSSLEAGRAVSEGIRRAMDAEVVVKPLADGGEGTAEALVYGMNAEKIAVEVTGPLGERVIAEYGIVRETGTAIVEFASAAGLALVPFEKRNPLHTTSYGVGEIIKDAVTEKLQALYRGGSAAVRRRRGLGMLQALGCRFFNDRGEEVGPFGRDLPDVARIDDGNMLRELKDCRFRVACDVKNPLCGEMGASRIFGPQKGTEPEMMEMLERALKRFARLAPEAERGTSALHRRRCGGGAGFAFWHSWTASLESGVSIVIDEIGLEEDIRDADIVVTGEGRLDAQTVMGKAPAGVASLAKKHSKPVIAFAGCASENARVINEAGIDAYFPIIQAPMTVQEAMGIKTARSNLETAAEQVFRLIKICGAGHAT